MIYDPKLESFIKVADAGSFNKASLQLPISSTALIKQINLLESELDVKLFDRTHTGLKLTKAGESFYQDAKYIIEYSHKALQRAKKSMRGNREVVRIGTSPMTPTQILTNLWPQIRKNTPNIDIELVPFENTPENASEILRNLGSQIDLVFGIFDETLLNLRECSAFEISREPIYCALSVDHPLANKEILSVEDLYEENLMIIKRNWSSYMDKLRDDLLRDHPQINITDFDFYSLDIFNHCEHQKDLILVIGQWSNIHPAMKTIPVQWDYTIPFGILHSPKPAKTVELFLETLKKVVNKSTNEELEL